jgi:DNA-binding beta-propeller fold protein YncE
MSALIFRRSLAAVAAAFLLTSITAGAQFTTSLSGPVLGYVFDRSAGKVRPIKGILGSASIGAAIESEMTATEMLTLDSNHAVASSETSPELLALNLSGSSVSAVTIPDAPARPSRSAVSLQGTAAAFYYSDTHQLRIISGLPNEPRLAGLLQAEQSLAHMAVSDDGTLLLFSVAHPEGDSIHLWTAESGSTSFVTSAVSISGIAMMRSGDAIVTDRVANEVFAIWNLRGGGVRQLLAGTKEGVSIPLGVAVSSGNRIYVANVGLGTAMVFDANGRFLKHQQCDCTISGIYPLRDSVFRLTDRIDQTTFLLDATSTDERILFVPPPQE